MSEPTGQTPGRVSVVREERAQLVRRLYDEVGDRQKRAWVIERSGTGVTRRCACGCGRSLDGKPCDLAAALAIAIRVHASQVDKQGAPYLLHVLRVVEAVSDEAKVVAALHDVIEDGGAEGERMVLGLDLSGAEGAALRILTRRPRVPYQEYIDLIAKHVAEHGALAGEVKLADLRDNLGRIPPEPDALGAARYARWDREWFSLKARYERAITTLEGTA